MHGSGLAVAVVGFTISIGPVSAGPCTAEINDLQKQVRLSSANPVASPAVGPTGTQSVAAQLHHQPTPGAVEHAESHANADADAALDRARKADEQGNATGCQEALRQARLLYGLAEN